MITVTLILLQIYLSCFGYKNTLQTDNLFNIIPKVLQKVSQSLRVFLQTFKEIVKIRVCSQCKNIHFVFKLKSGCDYHELFSIWKHGQIFTVLVESLRSFFNFVNQCACELGPKLYRRFELKHKQWRWSIIICFNGELNKCKRQKIWISLKWFSIQPDSSAWWPYSGQHVPYRSIQRLWLARGIGCINASRYMPIVPIGTQRKTEIRITKAAGWNIHAKSCARHSQ